MVSAMSYISADVASFLSLFQAYLIHIINYSGLDISSPLASGSKLIIMQIVLARYNDKDNDNSNAGFHRILLIKAKGLLVIFVLWAVRVGRSALCYLIENYFPCTCGQL
jgi:hypothetical protein